LALPAVHAAGSLPVRAQSFRTKPIRVVVPIAPGGGMDIVARIMASKIGAEFRQQVIVDSCPAATLSSAPRSWQQARRMVTRCSSIDPN